MIQRAAGQVDFVLLGAVCAILIVGLDMVYSASYVIAHNDPSYGSDTYFFTQQLTRAAAGLALLAVVQRVDYHRWRFASVPLLSLAGALLVAVLVTRFSHSAYGAQRWLKLGPLPAIEPSEITKLALTLFSADWLSRQRPNVSDFFQSTLPIGVVTAGLCALVILQPDVGTAFVLGAIALAVYFVAGADTRHLLLGLAAGFVVLAAVVLGGGYRSQRIAAYLDASRDPLGAGWNITQAQIALGSGGLFGLGLGASRQKFYYLPNAHTDAIFAVVGEELGLVGSVLLLLLFGLVAFRGFHIALRAPDSFGSLLAIGITCGIVLQAWINVGVITALLPFTGIPLPFVSYGGSSLVVSLLGIGVLLNLSRQAEPSADRAGRPSVARVTATPVGRW